MQIENNIKKYTDIHIHIYIFAILQKYYDKITFLRLIQ